MMTKEEFIKKVKDELKKEYGDRMQIVINAYFEGKNKEKQFDDFIDGYYPERELCSNEEWKKIVKDKSLLVRMFHKCVDDFIDGWI